jgi:hypothetical protein
MNDFEKCLNENNLNNILIKDKEDLEFISSLSNIEIVKRESKQGIKNKKNYYNWFVFDSFGNKFALNLSRTDTKYVKRLITIYCKTCGKKLGQFTLSQIFELKFSNIVKLSINCPHECKKCACTSNSINGQEKSKQTCLARYGVEYSFQSDNNKLKSVETKLKKYGSDWKKIQAAPMLNYYKRDADGKLLYHNSNDPVMRKQMVEKWKKTVAAKPEAEVREWRKKIICKTKSKICSNFLNELSKILNLKIEEEKKVGTKNIDGYIQDKYRR